MIQKYAKNQSKTSILKQVKTPLLMFMLTVIYLTFNKDMFSYGEAYLSLIVLLSFIAIISRRRLNFKYFTNRKIIKNFIES